MAFADASHFSKAFKRFYGDSPERFLRRMGTRTIPPPEIDS
jgi:AraC-like DNA-binding protein